METRLTAAYAATPEGQAAESTLRKCVHCGFCQATCPSYQVLGNELDSPRGRIYLIKDVLEGGAASRKTQQHLDQCLSCRNCETTCPSGVAYGELIDIGRKVVSEQVHRPWLQRATRKALAYGLTSRLVKPAFAIGRLFKPVLPSVLAKKLPAPRPAGTLPTAQHTKNVILPAGCIQPAMLPSIDAATIRVLDKLGFGIINPAQAQGAGCCGALRLHLDEFESSHAQMRRNIDAWYPLLKSGAAQAIIMNASGCGATVAEYGKHFASDPAYAEKARLVSDKTLDIGAFLAQETAALNGLLAKLPAPELQENAVFHPPCTLQHWQKLRPVVEGVLAQCGVMLKPFADSHLCCGSAGAYSVLQPKIAGELRDKKLAALAAAAPSVILSANIGCITHLASGTSTPVLHWVEWLDRRLSAEVNAA